MKQPELVGAAEVAAMLKVSRQRVHELVHRSDFPEPLARLAAGTVWNRADVERWAEKWDRKPGRRAQDA